jgi:uncharacterized membrane protein
MGLFLRQNDNRSELQSRVASELQERLKQKQLETEPTKPPEAILDNTRTTSVAKIIITVLALVVVALLFWLLRP